MPATRLSPGAVISRVVRVAHLTILPRMSQSSPAATGGAGTTFEQRVGALFLALLLTRSGPPFAPRAQVQRVLQQTEHLGWATDDYLIEAHSADGIRLRALVQVKRSFAITTNDENCAKAFTDAWRDFSNEGFDHANDSVLLITGALGRAPKEAFRMLLDCASASPDAGDFLRRLGLAGYLNDTARRYAAIVRTTLDGAKGSPITDDDFWRFLRRFQFAELDLETPAGITETLTKALLGARDGSMDAAEDDWNELLVRAASGAARATVHTRDAFSPRLLQRHVVPSSSWCQLGIVEDYSEIVARRVRRQIGAGRPLPRPKLHAEVLGHLETKRIVLLIGEAGSGKSGVARSVFDALSSRDPAVAFPAEAFAEPHLGNVLAPLGMSLRDFKAGPPGSGRIVVWVESLERLLEKTERLAFDDLANLVAQDDRFRLLVTCREYYAETAHAAFFERLGIASAVVRTPPLDDAELSEVATQSPHLQAPLANPRLKRLLRNPFILDMASRLSWSDPTPDSENEFRNKVWREVVRRDDLPADGMPAQREEVFTTIALRRARSLQPWVDVRDLSPDVRRRLSVDALLTVRPNAPDFAAPAHDVLEDWALLHWMQQEYLRHGATPTAFLAAVGVAPSLRRIYRRWLLELIDLHTEQADRFAFRLIPNSALPRHWQDDTLTAVLLSTAAASTLQRNAATLVANGQALLRRAVHLLRVAGKKSPPFLRESAAVPGIFLLPHGSAWSAVMILIEAEIQHFGRNDVEFLTSFLEDFVRLCTAQNPYPAGADSAARVAWRLLPAQADHFRPDSLHARLAKVVLNVPRPIAAELTARIKEHLPSERFDRWRPSLAQLALRFLGGQAVARDLPDLVVTCAERWLGIDGLEPEDRDNRYGRPHESEVMFGLPKRLHFETFPASAWRGPFLALLHAHPRVGVELVLRFVNRAIAAYAEPENHFRFGPPPPQVSIAVGTTGPVRQFAEGGFWLMFRAAGHGPHALESALMALEDWLLAKADRGDADLAQWLEELLLRSNNVAITAVVASIACAAPHAAGPSAIAVLTTPVFFDWDLQRTTVDQMAVGERIAAMFGNGDAEGMLFDFERKSSSERPHRRLTLEWLAAKLQTTEQRLQVDAIIDRYRAELPPLEAQNDEHRVWRLRLGRMDHRGLRVVSDEAGQPRVVAPTPAPDIQRLIERVQPGLDRHGSVQSSLNWGMHEFQAGRPGDEKNHWSVRLGEAETLRAQADLADEAIDQVNHRAAASYIAAVCVRDNWTELSASQRNWCVATAIEAIKRPVNHGAIVSFDDTHFNAAQPAGWMLGLLLGYELTAEMRAAVYDGFAAAFTHDVKRVRLLTAGGVQWNPEPTQAQVAHCLHALSAEAATLMALNAAEEKENYQKRRAHSDLASEARAKTRAALLAPPSGVAPDLNLIGLAERDVRDVLALALTLVGSRRDSDLARTFYAMLSRQLLAVWEADRNDRGGSSNRDLEMEDIVGRRLAEFSLTVSAESAGLLLQPLIDRMESFPRELAKLLDDLTTAEDRQHSGATYWSIWQLIVDRFLSGGLATDIEDRGRGASLLARLFLTAEWKKGTTDWRPLHGHHQRIDRLFQALPHTATPLASYSRYLHSVGGGALPRAFVPLAEGLAALPPEESLSGDTLLHLEIILAHHVHGMPGALKSDGAVHAAVENLLEHLIERGSAAAFRMRDDFVTPTA